ncbi:DUF6259 domain-containing protein [Microbacterium sp. A196]|uniref:DUF6259 domain-containing protein n=1 Tax=Microbacterium sp. A196 TaxID=3457320 RepID=UPI003FD57E2E
MTRTPVHHLTAGTLRLSISDDGSVVEWSDPTTGLRSTPGSDMWTMSTEHGDLRDSAVRSSSQRGRVISAADSIEVIYDSLVSDGGDALAVALRVRIQVLDGSFVFSATGEVAGAVTVHEVMLPVLSLAQAASTDRSSDVLFRPFGLGQRIVDPWRTLERAHTEYMSADHKGVWTTKAYPGELTMAWQGLQSDDHFLYVARHDAEFRAALFSAGVNPRGAAQALNFGTTALPSARQGQTFEIPQNIIAWLPGDWRTGAAYYRAWADTWYTGPVRQEATAELDGWQRLIMRHQFGEVYLRYGQLVEAWEAGRTAGLDTILLFGWWQQGMDRGYPVYDVDPALGTAQELREAIAQIESRGGSVMLYANGNLIDRTSDFYASDASLSTKKDRSGLDYVVGYNFANESKSLPHFAGPGFTLGCHGAATWRDMMTGVAADNLALGTNSIFFDQTAYHLIAWPCYDARHDHGEKVDQEGVFRAKTLEGMRSQGEGVVLGSEGMTDFLISRLDYHHGWGFGYSDHAEAFPALFRQTFPEPVVSNRLIHDQLDGWEHQLHYALVYNLVFDVAIYRCRALVTEFPEYAAKIRELLGYRKTYRRFFREGVFEAADQDWGDDPIVTVAYRHAGEVLTIRWNSTDAQVSDDAGVVFAPNQLVFAVASN